ncbi:hypothetical protein [Mucilaginibacter glaciei]|uniref:HNH endonuclease n=1 Tax=Mucilaginibacter glaciei TaxID=2772109 RepID=A0A926NVC1_9SPHI|nr:hypothetical protein [Mucilaginibacter glaciei]MBD1395375.1 hypothetical protein [Mucilaginibacter glaciei]
MNKYINYFDLLADYDNSKKPTYKELITTYEWKTLRDSIVKRDGNKCSNCNSIASIWNGSFYIRKPTNEEQKASFIKHSLLIKDNSFFTPKFAVIAGVKDDSPTILHVHHPYYILNFLPWEYPSEDLITVCHSCHTDIHNSSVVPTYVDVSRKELVKLTPCESVMEQAI